MRLPVLAIALGLAALAAVAEAAELTVQAEMKQIVEPASNTLFSVGGDADPANGPDAPKVADARWTDAADAARQLGAVAAGLNDKGRVRPGAEWTAFVKDFAAQSAAARKAANARDGAGLSTAANALSDACSACHAKYKPQTAG